MIKLTEKQMFKIAEKIPYDNYQRNADSSEDAPTYVGQIGEVTVLFRLATTGTTNGAVIKCESEGIDVGYLYKEGIHDNAVLDFYNRIHLAVDPTLKAEELRKKRVEQRLNDLLKEE